MFRDHVIPALEYAAYSFGWRRAPRLLSVVEELGHHVRNRVLVVELHRAVIDALPLSVRVIAWDAALRDEIAHRVGGTRCRERDVRSAALVPTLRGADLTFIELPEFRAAPFLEAGFFAMPKRIAHVETLGAPDPSLVRRIRRAMAARGISATETRDPRALSRFVREVYRPSVEARHRARARPTPESVLQLVLLRGRLIEVHERGRRVSGALVAPSLLDAGRLEIVVIGTTAKDDEVIRTAPVVFARDLALREGFARCDHLGSSPFVDDGVFRRKQRYGTVLEDMEHRRDRVMVDVSNTPAARAFVARAPFVVIHQGVRSVEELVGC